MGACEHGFMGFHACIDACIDAWVPCDTHRCYGSSTITCIYLIWTSKFHYVLFWFFFHFQLIQITFYLIIEQNKFKIICKYTIYVIWSWLYLIQICLHVLEPTDYMWIIIFDFLKCSGSKVIQITSPTS